MRIGKWTVCIVTIVLLLMFGFSIGEENNKKMTLMIYICGSNLESINGSASIDMEEMKNAGFSRDLNVFVMSGGANRWMTGYDANKVHVQRVIPNGIITLQSLDSISMGDPETLRWFIDYCMTNSRTDDYALIIWDHGAGPLGGVCLDEQYSPDRLSLTEIKDTFDSLDLDSPFKWIGFDACLMSSLEVAYSISPYARYMIASQATEPSTGWDYSFLNGLEDDLTGVDTAKRIGNLYISSDSGKNDILTLSCIDLSCIEDLVLQMDSFFSENIKKMSRDSFTQLSDIVVKTTSYGRSVRAFSESGYDLFDLHSLLNKLQTDNNAERVLDSLNEAVVYKASNEKEPGCGLSVYHPYNNKKMFSSNWKNDYKELDFCPGYTKYIEKFGTILVSDDFTDWSEIGLISQFNNELGETHLSLKLTDDQLASVLSAQFLIFDSGHTSYLSPSELGFGIAEETHEKLMNRLKKYYETNTDTDIQLNYSPVYAENVSISDDGLFTATYKGRSLYIVDENGEVLEGPLAYQLSDEDDLYCIKATYVDLRGEDDSLPETPVLFMCRENNNYLDVVRTDVYDPISNMYTNRIAVHEDDFSQLDFDRLWKIFPFEQNPLRGFDTWEENRNFKPTTVMLPRKWKLKFMNTQQSNVQLFAAFQFTDVQQNTYLSKLIPLRNPNLDDIQMNPASIKVDELFEFSVKMLIDDSPLNGGLGLTIEIKNLESEMSPVFGINACVINHKRKILLSRSRDYDVINSSAFNDSIITGDLGYKSYYIPSYMLYGLENVNDITFEVVAYWNDNSHTYTIETSPQNCNINNWASKPLCEFEYNAVDHRLEMKLLSLENKENGDISVILSTYNPTTKDLINEMFFVQCENLYLNTSFRLDIKGGQEVISKFTIPNTVSLLDHHKSMGRFNEYLLADHPFESNNIHKISNLNFWMGYTTDPVVNVQLDHAISLRSTGKEKLEKNTESRIEKASLLEGDICAWLDKAVITDHSIGLRVYLQNTTDTPQRLEVINALVDGRAAEIELQERRSADEIKPAARNKILVLPRSKTLAFISIESPFPPGHMIKDFEFSFLADIPKSIDKYCFPLSKIVFNQSVLQGTRGCCFLRPDELSTEPAHYVQYDAFLSRYPNRWDKVVAWKIKDCTFFETGDIPSSIYDGEITIQCYTYDDVELQNWFSWKDVRNKTFYTEVSPDPMNMQKTHQFIIEHRPWFLGKDYYAKVDSVAILDKDNQKESIDIGNSIGNRFALDVPDDAWIRIPIEYLQKIDIDKMAFTFSIYKTGVAEPLYHGFVGCLVKVDNPYSNVTPFKPLGQCETDDYIVRILSLEIREDGMISGWFDIQRKHLKKKYVISDIYINDISSYGKRELITAEGIEIASYRCAYPFVCENSISVPSRIVSYGGGAAYALPQYESILERHGFRSIKDITIMIETESDICPVKIQLDKPVFLPDKTETQDKNIRLLLAKKEGISLWINSVIIGYNGVSLGLEIMNQSDGIRGVMLDKAYFDGNPAYWDQENKWILAPHTTTVTSIALSSNPFEQSLSACDPVTIADVVMNWTVLNAENKSEENTDIFANDLNAPLFSIKDSILSFVSPQILDKSNGLIISAEEYSTLFPGEYLNP